jgi:hypothetical protein
MYSVFCCLEQMWKDETGEVGISQVMESLEM